MKITYAADTYLEAISILQTEGVVVIAARIAEYLKVSRPTVTQMMKRLVAMGLVELNNKKEISLSLIGEQQANASLRRHRILERFLCDTLQLDWGTAHIEASHLERCLTPTVEKKLDEWLGFPTTCPHGNAIPGSDVPVVKAVPLSDMPVGVPLEIVRIFEQAEEEVELLRSLENNGFAPGQELSIVTYHQQDDDMSVMLQGKIMDLTYDVAKRLMVREL